MELFKVSWHLIGDTSMLLMTGSQRSPTYDHNEKLFAERQQAEEFKGKLFEAAALLGITNRFGATIYTVAVEDSCPTTKKPRS